MRVLEFMGDKLYTLHTIGNLTVINPLKNYNTDIDFLLYNFMQIKDITMQISDIFVIDFWSLK